MTPLKSIPKLACVDEGGLGPHPCIKQKPVTVGLNQRREPPFADPLRVGQHR